jgi:hypothetical protein
VSVRGGLRSAEKTGPASFSESQPHSKEGGWCSHGRGGAIILQCISDINVCVDDNVDHINNNKGEVKVSLVLN